jgi:hypothetical protein
MVLVVNRLRPRNPGQTRGKERPSGQAIECTATVIRRFGRKLFLATSLLLSSIGASFAHTVSIGYEALAGGVFDIWYGSYHSGVNLQKVPFNWSDLRFQRRLPLRCSSPLSRAD